MRTLTRTISGLALAGTILPPLLFFADRLDLDQTKWVMLLATIAWFAATPWWMDRADR
jgi:hypothetical protein